MPTYACSCLRPVILLIPILRLLAELLRRLPFPRCFRAIYRYRYRAAYCYHHRTVYRCRLPSTVYRCCLPSTVHHLLLPSTVYHLPLPSTIYRFRHCHRLLLLSTIITYHLLLPFAFYCLSPFAHLILTLRRRLRCPVCSCSGRSFFVSPTGPLELPLRFLGSGCSGVSFILKCVGV